MKQWGSFLQLHSRCPSQKWLIPLKLTIFNHVRESSNVSGGSLSWCFGNLYYQLQIDLANANQQAITFAEKSISRQWHNKNTGVITGRSIDLKIRFITSWWFQPNWKTLVKMGIFSQVGVKIKKTLKPPTRQMSQFLERWTMETPQNRPSHRSLRPMTPSLLGNPPKLVKSHSRCLYKNVVVVSFREMCVQHDFFTHILRFV